MELSKEKREEMIQELVAFDVEIADDESLAFVFEHGCVGYANMIDDDLIDFYNEFIQE